MGRGWELCSEPASVLAQGRAEWQSEGETDRRWKGDSGERMRVDERSRMGMGVLSAVGRWCWRATTELRERKGLVERPGGEGERVGGSATASVCKRAKDDAPIEAAAGADREGRVAGIAEEESVGRGGLGESVVRLARGRAVGW